MALSILGALMLGPLVAWVVGRSGQDSEPEDQVAMPDLPDGVSWKESLSTAFLQFVRATFKQTLRLGPIMVVRGLP